MLCRPTTSLCGMSRPTMAWSFRKLSISCASIIGIEHYYIHKNSPNENAVIERSFRTDQDEFFYLLERAPEDINELNRWFQRYLVNYNTVRPHMSLNMLTPKEVVALCNKS